jgi:hypothetical protein
MSNAADRKEAWSVITGDPWKGFFVTDGIFATEEAARQFEQKRYGEHGNIYRWIVKIPLVFLDAEGNATDRAL